MAKNYKLVTLVRDSSVKAVLIKALNDGRLSYEDVKMIIDSTSDGKGVTLQEFNDLQEILKTARTLDMQAKKYIKDFLELQYINYLHLHIKEKQKIVDLPYTKNHIPTTTKPKRRPGLAITPIYLTIHSTANLRSTAKDERNWLTNTTNKRHASYHLVVDEKEVIECIPLNEIAWHAGDENGTGNKESIGLEICESGDREKTLKNAIHLTAKILKDREWDTSKLKRHYDWNEKICPRILIDSSHRNTPTQTWDWFQKEVSKLLPGPKYRTKALKC